MMFIETSPFKHLCYHQFDIHKTNKKKKKNSLHN